MRSTRITWLAAFAAAAALTTPAWAVQVAPNVIFIQSGDRGAELMVHNPGGSPMEVHVQLVFGYEDAGADDRVSAVYPEDMDHPRSAVDWLRAYPQRAVLAPGQRQVIRLFRRSPADLPAGEYWARVSVEARPTEIPTRELVEEQIRLQVGVTTQQRVPVFVRIGESEASLEIAEATARLSPRTEGEDGDREVVVRYRGEVSGNAAFLGSLSVRLERDGAVLAEDTVPIAFFVAGWRRVRLRLQDGVDRETLGGAKVVIQAFREHPVVQERHLVPGRGGRWEGSLELE